MALPVTIPNTFANATSSIPLSQLDTNFSTLANAVNGLNSGSETLANLKATTANVGVLTVTGNATIGDASTDTVTLNSTLTANTAVIFAAGTSAAPSITTTGDTNTGIFFPAADTIAFAEGGAEAMRINSSGTVMIGTSTNAGGRRLNVVGRIAATNSDAVDNQLLIGADAGEAFVAATYASNGSYQPLTFYTSATERMRITSAGNVGIGTTGPDQTLVVKTANGGGIGIENASAKQWRWAVNSDSTFSVIESGVATRMTVDTSGNVGVNTISPNGKLEVVSTSAGANTNTLFLTNASSNASTATSLVFGVSTSPTTRNATIRAINAGSNAINLAFLTSNGDVPAERARITSDGNFYVGRTTDLQGERCLFEKSGAGLLACNRTSDDGGLVRFYQDGTQEGEITVSGNTVTYGSFSGGHWSQLQQGRGYNPDIPRGTVMSSIGEMAEWKSVIWDEVIEHPAVPAVEAKEAVVDEEGNVVEPAVEAVEGKDAWAETIPHREHYLGQLPVGATFEEDGVTKTVVDDGNERLPKVKISDVVGDKAVYGVFQTWDEAQDMMVVGLGTFVVRIASGVTVQIGDLLESNGDGCAKVQDDDVIRSKTIGKVTSITPSATYADGSYTVPAVLYCG